jgi:hypothetical protein
VPGARLFIITLGIAIAAAVAPHQARSQPTAKPYERVRVTSAPVPTDAGYTAFRANLAAIAARRIFAELAGNVIPHGFFWDSDFTGSFDPKKTGAENLAAAIRLEEGSGRGWQMLADFAAEPTATEIAALPGVICAPGAPVFSQDDFDRLVDATRTTAADWVFPRMEGVELRVAAQRKRRGREARRPFRAHPRLRHRARHRRSAADVLGSDRGAQRPSRLRRAGQPVIAWRAAAVLREGHHRTLAHRRLCRRPGGPLNCGR